MNHVRTSIALTASSAIAVTSALGALAGFTEAGGGFKSAVANDRSLIPARFTEMAA